MDTEKRTRKKIQTYMSDTPRMDAAFNQPTSTTPRMNWQLDQCYREGCKLERNLAEAQNLLKQCLSAMPVGYIPTHTAENLPEMICDLAKALAEETTERENLERELATVTEQRDRLAEALKEIYNVSSFDYDTMPELARKKYREVVLEMADTALQSLTTNEL